MCKLIILTNATKIENIDEFSRYAAELLSDMPDGYGFAAQGEAGVFGIRTLLPENYALAAKLPDFCETVEEPFGTVSKVTGAAMFHGRMSTNVHDLANTHPITREGWNLMHNGVVTDHGAKYEMLTENDSEHVLKHLIDGGIDAVADNLTGYYAGGAFDIDGQLHVFRDGIANLFYARSETLDSDIFATTADLIEDIGSFLGENLVGAKVKADTYLVYQDGIVVEQKSFLSRGYDTHSKSLAHKSLGHSLTDFNDAMDLAPGYREEDESDHLTEYTSDDAPFDDTKETSEIMRAYHASKRRLA